MQLAIQRDRLPGAGLINCAAIAAAPPISLNMLRGAGWED
jgi:hypothetical protein